MKKILFSALFLCCGILMTTSMAQERRAPSPASKVEQRVGLTDITIEYSRPSMKDRKIMGELVPYGKQWRTGANSATKITFSDDVTVGGKALAAGSYALFTVPGETSWKVRFYPYEKSSAGSYGEATAAAEVMSEPFELGCTVESFLININNLRDNSAQLQLVWENTGVGVDIGVK